MTFTGLQALSESIFAELVKITNCVVSVLMIKGDCFKANKEFTVKEGEMYTCTKGKTDGATNISNVVGIHRIGILIPA